MVAALLLHLLDLLNQDYLELLVLQVDQTLHLCLADQESLVLQAVQVHQYYLVHP